MGKISSGPKSHQPRRTRGVWMQTLSYNKIHVVISMSKKHMSKSKRVLTEKHGMGNKNVPAIYCNTLITDDIFAKP